MIESGDDRSYTRPSLVKWSGCGRWIECQSCTYACDAAVYERHRLKQHCASREAWCNGVNDWECGCMWHRQAPEGPLGDLGCRPNEWVYCTNCKVILF